MSRTRFLTVVAAAVLAAAPCAFLLYSVSVHSRPNADARVAAEAAAIGRGSLDFHRHYGSWPNGLGDLTHNPDNKRFMTFARYALDGSTPLDAWKTPYLYVPYETDRGFGLIISWGADGKPGGKDASRDRIYPFGEKSQHQDAPLQSEGAHTSREATQGKLPSD